MHSLPECSPGSTDPVQRVAVVVVVVQDPGSANLLLRVVNIFFIENGYGRTYGTFDTVRTNPTENNVHDGSEPLKNIIIYTTHLIYTTYVCVCVCVCVCMC